MKKVFQFVLIATIVVITGYFFATNAYGPIPARDKGFPLTPVLEIKLNDNIRQVIVSENNKVFVRLGYSVNSLSLETGELLWKYRIDEPIYSIAAYKGIIYVVGKEVLLTLDEESGKLLWQQATVINSPSLEPEIRYVDDSARVIL
jgi:outer membrane protein assembly factor BamB